MYKGRISTTQTQKHYFVGYNSLHGALNTPARDIERAICPEFAFTVYNENLGYNMDPHL